MDIIEDIDGRQSFFESWIQEMPQHKANRNDITALRYNISDLIKYIPERSLGNDIFSIVGQTSVFVYYKKRDAILAAIELTQRPENLTVISVGKDIDYEKNPPFVTDLYAAALNIAQGKSLKLTSDNMMTSDGLEVWRRLLDQGYAISVFDQTNPGTSHVKIDDYSQLTQYFGTDPKYANYRYTLSESVTHWVHTVREVFLTRRLRELAGIA